MIGTHKKNISEILGRDPVHPFPARMAPGIALEVISAEGRRLKVLDPMTGSGTVLAVAHSKGHKVFGVDIDPLAVLISKVWITPIDRKHVRKAADKILKRAQQKAKRLKSSNSFPKNSDQDTREFIEYWFDTTARKELTALASEISRVRNERVRNALWCGFSRLIITKKKGASLAMDLSHSRPHKVFTKAPIKPFDKWLDSVDRVLNNCLSIETTSNKRIGDIRVGDARKLPIKARSIDLVLTSPPYLNAIDYIRCSKFSLVWMGHKTDGLKRIRNVSVGSEATFKFEFASDEIKAIIDSLKIKRRLSPRHLGILTRFVIDMHKSIQEVSRVLASGGKAVYVVGENTVRNVFIKNSEIIIALAKSCGLRLLEKRTRALPANRRYLPPPKKGKRNRLLNARMRREVVLAFGAKT